MKLIIASFPQASLQYFLLNKDRQINLQIYTYAKISS